MSEIHSPARIGIAAAGNWIVDKVKTVDALPAKGMLANILGETISTGGAPANVLADLSQLGAPFPLIGLGVVGDDEAGELILDRFRRFGVDVSQMVMTPAHPTSYTDVMSQSDTGERSFFHFRGANATFAPEHVKIDLLQCKILHLGYLLLFDRMDKEDSEYGTVGARFLSEVRRHGMATSIDLVSEESERFQRIIPPSLKHVDYLFMNEIEAARTTGIEIRAQDQSLNWGAIGRSIECLSQMGKMRMIAIHMPEGAILRMADGSRYASGSLNIPAEQIAGTTGAGDAFCAGMLYGIHENFSMEKTLQLGICCAASCLLASDASSGVMPIKDVLALANKYPYRQLPSGAAR